MQTEIIVGPRRSGKTIKLIQKSHDTGAVIVCPTTHASSVLSKIADNAGYPIPFPISYREFIDGQYSARSVSFGFLIDNAENLLQEMSQVPIMAITLNESEV